MHKRDQPQTAPESNGILGDTADATESTSQVLAAQPDRVDIEQQGNTAATVNDITVDRKVVLLEQQLEVANQQSRKHEEHAR